MKGDARRETFEKKERVRERGDFLRLTKRGARYHSRQYTVFIVKNNKDYSRLALSVKKRVGNAVMRNYEKRVCRTIFRKELSKKLEGFDILIMVKERTQSFYASCNTLRQLFCRFLQSARMEDEIF